jgi:hypothetical protein
MVVISASRCNYARAVFTYALRYTHPHAILMHVLSSRTHNAHARTTLTFALRYALAHTARYSPFRASLTHKLHSRTCYCMLTHLNHPRMRHASQRAFSCRLTYALYSGSRTGYTGLPTRSGCAHVHAPLSHTLLTRTHYTYGQRTVLTYTLHLATPALYLRTRRLYF